jgi:cyanophycinase
MSGLIALVGAGEYLELMDTVDIRLLAATGKSTPRVVCVPTAAAQEGEASIERWAQMGLKHFRRLGAAVDVARIIDRESANDAKWATMLEAADLMYFSGGNPLDLYRILADTRAWAAIETTLARGAIFAGCSAGAMILGAVVPDIRDEENFQFHPAFNKLPNCLIMPHFDQLESYRPGLTAFMQSKLSDGQYALGIDEHTALIGRSGGEWEVMGKSSVSVLTRTDWVKHPVGSRLSLPG